MSELPSREIERLAGMDRPGELALVAFAADHPDTAMPQAGPPCDERVAQLRPIAA